MRFLYFASLLGSVAAIDSLAELTKELPQCSIECLMTAVSDAGCTLTDAACVCSNVQEIVKSASPCLIQAGCNLDDLSSASSSVADICASQVATPTASGASETSAAPETVPTNGQPSLAHQGSLWAGAGVAVVVALW
ncbi:Extracellular membrane CFEM domain [Fusarium albosuccineum]|uniref:Extracellular membrane CFEM domain n=1 Tax=Fusarium albosuccineum TaxID=1237068 RepID=A0A8H4PAI3_9HYPO|nr:Extracellular membrane CFEM domain [Fusarium albosuccineum]